MDRRTLLKLLGAAPAVTLTPAVAKASLVPIEEGWWFDGERIPVVFERGLVEEGGLSFSVDSRESWSRTGDEEALVRWGQENLVRDPKVAEGYFTIRETRLTLRDVADAVAAEGGPERYLRYRPYLTPEDLQMVARFERCHEARTILGIMCAGEGVDISCDLCEEGDRLRTIRPLTVWVYDTALHRSNVSFSRRQGEGSLVLRWRLSKNGEEVAGCVQRFRGE